MVKSIKIKNRVMSENLNLLFRDVAIGPGETTVRGLYPHDMDSSALVHEVGLYIGAYEGEIKARGGLFFGDWYDPMDDGHAGATGGIFSMCQAMGIPCTFLCDDMSWASGYAGYAAMLGVRKELVWFGTTWKWDASEGIRSEKLEGLQSLQKAGFKTWVSIRVSEAFSVDMHGMFKSHLAKLLSMGCAVFYTVDVDAAVFNASLWGDILINVSEVLEDRKGLGFVCFNPAAYSALQADGDFSMPSFVQQGHDVISHFAAVDMSRVEAGDIDAMVEGAASYVRDLAQERFEKETAGLSRRARRAAQRQLKKDRSKVESQE